MGDESDSSPSLRHIVELGELRDHALAAAQQAMGDMTAKVPVPGELTVSGQRVADITDTISPVDHDIVIAPGDSCPTCGRPMPMTGAQRQARWRAKERNG